MSTRSWILFGVVSVILAVSLVIAFVDWEDWVSWTILGVVTAFVVPLSILWIVKSIGSVGKDEVAVPVWWGDPEERILTSGLVFVPWVFGITFDGRTLCELVRIPTTQLPFDFKGLGGVGEEQLIWSSDRIALFVDITGWVRFPYKEADSLCTMIKAGVPLNATDLSAWIRAEVVSGLRDILAGYDHKQAIARSNLEKIREAAKVFFLNSSGLFATSGICGNDLTSFEPGKGEVIIRIDNVDTDEETRKAMASPVISAYKAEAAKKEAEVSAALLDDTNQALKTWLADRPGAPKEEIVAKQKELHERAVLKAGGQQIHIKGLENATTAVVGGGGTGGTGILVGNPGGGTGGKGNKPNAGESSEEKRKKNKERLKALKEKLARERAEEEEE